METIESLYNKYVLTHAEPRSTQAVAQLLNLSGGRENSSSILAMLVSADYRAVKESLCDSRQLFLKTAHDCLAGSGPALYWKQFIDQQGEELVLLADPGDDDLSDFDVETLEDAHKNIRKQCPKCFSTAVKTIAAHNPDVLNKYANVTLRCNDCKHDWEDKIISDFFKELLDV